MTHQYADTVFTASVKAQQQAYGSLEHNEKLQANFGPNDEFSPRESQFIANRDSFYMATVNDADWPYVQHRGGPKGFLKVLGPKLLGFADYRGNRQLVSTGNISVNDRCSLMLMDYPNRKRLKILGRVHVADPEKLDTETLVQFDSPDYAAVIERIFLIDLVAFDWNCPQHITRRFSEAEIATLSETSFSKTSLGKTSLGKKAN